MGKYDSLFESIPHELKDIFRRILFAQFFDLIFILQQVVSKYIVYVSSYTDLVTRE